MAEEKKQEMLDPIAYREDFPKEYLTDYDPMADLTPEYLENMDYGKAIGGGNQSFSQYWDDSSPEYQQKAKWWLNDKYTGEGVKNDQVNYDANLMLKDLNPNFVYWLASKVYGTDHPWYITQRNDQIASALYNEWKTSKDDVAYFLWQQKWWMNSSEADRANTIEAVYKRLWAIAEQNPKEEEKPDLSKADNLVQDTSGKIYWKTTAEEWEPSKWIDTLADANSVFTSMQEKRSAEVKTLASMDSEKVWYLISEWKNPFGDQAMRDLQELYPEKYAEIQAQAKKIKWQQDIDSISTWGKVDVTSQLTASEDNVTTSMNNFVNSTASGSWAWTLSTNLNNALSQSEIVSGAREQMEVYKRKIVEIQQAADELPSLANQYFKWDVPQYLVNAFVNNRLQKYNKEIEKYQNLYNASLDEAKFEVSQAQWREEMNYKWANLQADQNYKNANLELNKKELEFNMKKSWVSNWKWNDDGSYSYVDLDGNMHTLTAEEAKKAINQELYNKSTAFIDYWKKAIDDSKANWMDAYWWECEAMSDNYARQNFGTEMKKEDWSAWATTVDEKARYATEALPQRWYVAVFDFWIKQSDWVNYWHTWIVIDYNPVTWDFTTLESNVDWKWKVEIKTRNINSSNLIWFWDPTVAEPWNWWSNWTAIDSYINLPNWMLDVFIGAEKKMATGEERKYVRQWREWYWILNMMINNWEMDAMINWDEIASTIDEFTKYLTENASNRLIVDEEGNFIMDTVLQSMLNSGKIVNQKERDALAHLYRLVQIKLRRDSWAAINIWEWMWDYNMYLPQVWLSKQQKMQRLFDLERAAIESVMPDDYVKKYVPLITEEMIKKESNESVEQQRNESTWNSWLSRKKSENK